LFIDVVKHIRTVFQKEYAVGRISTFEEVRALIGHPTEFAHKKIYRQLNDGMIRFIERSSLLFISSIGADGFPSVSPRGDHAGFVRVRDSKTLLVPERKGNKLAYSLQNMLTNPNVALIFIVPNTSETLRVSGVTTIVDDAELNVAMSSATQPSLLVIEVKIEQCFFHCAKSLMRSKVWDRTSWGDRMPISFGAEIAGNLGNPDGLADKLDEGVRGRYVTDI
jgi:uncharacterized protein